MSTAIRMSRDSVAAVICPEAMARVREVFHSEMIFGPHHVWEHGAVMFTGEGLALAIERLREKFPGDALALQTEVASRVFALPGAKIEAAASPEPLAGPRVRSSSRYWDDL